MERLDFDLKEMHKIQINLLNKLDSVCREHSLKYFLAFGSLLGAVREHSIIEWDDGIDLVMSYRDYKELIMLPQTVWGTDFFMQTYDTEPEYNRYYAKLRDNNTTLVLAEDIDKDINHGIPINIYPLISLSDDEGERRSQIRNAKIYKAIIEEVPVSSENVIMHAFSSAFLEVASEQQKQKIREYLKSELIQFENTNSNCCFALAGNKSLDLVLFKKWFASALEWDFEGMKVSIPAGWSEWLKLRYGDYMKKPITELQGSKIANFVTLNLNKPYTYYKGKTYCI